MLFLARRRERQTPSDSPTPFLAQERDLLIPEVTAMPFSAIRPVSRARAARIPFSELLQAALTRRDREILSLDSERVNSTLRQSVIPFSDSIPVSLTLAASIRFLAAGPA